MKCAFISVLMNLIYGEGPVHNFLPSKTVLKSAIHLCNPAVITNHTIVHSQIVLRRIRVFRLAQSVTETLYQNSAQMIHINNL